MCKTLDDSDEATVAAGEPERAVLVVRESNRLPDQGWWSGARIAFERDGADWTGAQARVLVRRLQTEAFAHWQSRGHHHPTS